MPNEGAAGRRAASRSPLPRPPCDAVRSGGGDGGADGSPVVLARRPPLASPCDGNDELYEAATTIHAAQGAAAHDGGAAGFAAARARFSSDEFHSTHCAKVGRCVGALPSFPSLPSAVGHRRRPLDVCRARLSCSVAAIGGNRDESLRMRRLLTTFFLTSRQRPTTRTRQLLTFFSTILLHALPSSRVCVRVAGTRRRPSSPRAARAPTPTPSSARRRRVTRAARSLARTLERVRDLLARGAAKLDEEHMGRVDNRHCVVAPPRERR